MNGSMHRELAKTIAADRHRAAARASTVRDARAAARDARTNAGAGARARIASRVRTLLRARTA